jgi:fibronectin type 3 domain-containing protein
MKNTMVRWILTGCSLTLILTSVASCGRKTAPLTPDSPRPEVITDIKVVARDNVAYLSWRVPVKNIENKEMPPAAIEGFRVYRAEMGSGVKKARYKLIVEISMAKPAPAEVKNGLVFWSDKNLKYGQVYAYKIRAESTRGGVSAFSNEIRIVPLLSLAPPKNLVAAGGDSSLLVTWDAVTTRMDGSRYEGFVGYNVYRGTGQGRYDGTPLNPEPLRTPSYKDTAVVIGTMYYYMVRSVDSPAPPWKESVDSGEVSAAPKKLTPPEKPIGLTVVPGVGRIFLTWNENKERDLDGYHVYRSEKSGRDYARLNDKLLNRSTYSDETVKPGITYYYVITAVDKYGNESAWSKEQKAYAERLR